MGEETYGTLQNALLKFKLQLSGDDTPEPFVKKKDPSASRSNPQHGRAKGGA